MKEQRGYMCLYEAHVGVDKADFTYAGVDENGVLVEEPWDHGLPVFAETKGALVNLSAKSDATNGKWRSILKIDSDSKSIISIIVTDARVVFYCPKYKRWSGSGLGALVAAGANAAAKSKAPEGSKGMMLLGQIRYEWLTGVVYKIKTGFLGPAEMTLTYSDDDDNHWQLEMVFYNKGTDTEQVSNAIVQKAARYRLAMADDKDDEEMGVYTEYADEKKIPVKNPKELSWLWFPSSYNAPGGENFRPDPGAFA